jgi:hypothetical protein
MSQRLRLSADGRSYHCITFRMLQTRRWFAAPATRSMIIARWAWRTARARVESRHTSLLLQQDLSNGKAAIDSLFSTESRKQGKCQRDGSKCPDRSFKVGGAGNHEPRKLLDEDRVQPRKRPVRSQGTATIFGEYAKHIICVQRAPGSGGTKGTSPAARCSLTLISLDGGIVANSLVPTSRL